MLDHVNLSNDDLVVVAQFLKLLWVEGPHRAIGHDNCVAAILVNQIEHVGAHSLDLEAVNLQNLIRRYVHRRVGELDHEALALFLVAKRSQADDCMIVKEGQHAVRVVDHVTLTVGGSEGHRLVGP